MKEQVLNLARRAWADFRRFSPGQKAVTIVAVIAVLIGGVVYATWSTPPKYAPLYTNLAASDASAIIDKLNADAIPYKLNGDGTSILVPKDKVYSTRITLSGAGLPQNSQSGYSLLDKEGVTTSEFKQQVDYQRAVEGELAKTIQAINGVQAASVHLAIPQQNVFNDGTQKPSAAVMLTLGAGTTLTTQQVQSIVYLVSSSVTGMTPDAVTVTNSAGQVLSAPGSGVTDSAATSTQTEATQNYDTQLANSLQSIIDPVVGAGHAVVTVNAQLDFSKTNTTTRTYTSDPKNPPLSEQETKEKYTGSQVGQGGILGSGTGADTTGGTNGLTGGTYSKETITKDNALGTVTQVSQNAPGQVQKLSIAVLVDKSSPNVNVAALNSLVSNAVGLNTARGDTLSVQAMPFDTSAQKTAAALAAAAAKKAAAKKAHAHKIALIKQGTLGLAVLLILGWIWWSNRRKRRRPTPAVVSTEPVNIATASEPETVIDTTELSDAFAEAAARRHALTQLAEEQPGDVAHVLSNWLRP